MRAASAFALVAGLLLVGAAAADPSIRRFSVLGAALVPLTLCASLLVTRV